MKKLYAAMLLSAAALATPAQAMTWYLTAQWTENGARFCKYANGTVLNVGVKLCPLHIES